MTGDHVFLDKNVVLSMMASPSRPNDDSSSLLCQRQLAYFTFKRLPNPVQSKIHSQGYGPLCHVIFIPQGRELINHKKLNLKE